MVHIDPDTFHDYACLDLPEEYLSRDASETLQSALDATSNAGLTAFALRLALSTHRNIPREDQPDFLAEANAVFQPAKKPKAKRQKPPTPIRTPAKKTAPKKKLAA